MYLEERYGKGNRVTDLDSDQYKWESMSKKWFQNPIKILQDIENFAEIMDKYYNITHDEREIRRKLKQVIPKEFEKQVESLGTR